MALENGTPGEQREMPEWLVNVFSMLPAPARLVVLNRLGKQETYVNAMAADLQETLRTISPTEDRPYTQELGMVYLVTQAEKVVRNKDARVRAWRQGIVREDDVRGVVETQHVRVSGDRLEILATAKAIYGEFLRRALGRENGLDEESAEQAWRDFLTDFNAVMEHLSNETNVVHLTMIDGYVLRIDITKKEACFELGITDDADGTLEKAVAEQKSAEKVAGYVQRVIPADRVTAWLADRDPEVQHSDVTMDYVETRSVRNDYPSLTQEQVEALMIELQKRKDEYECLGVEETEFAAKVRLFEAVDNRGRFSLVLVQASGGNWRVQVKQTGDFYNTRKAERQGVIKPFKDALIKAMLEGSSSQNPIVISLDTNILHEQWGGESQKEPLFVARAVSRVGHAIQVSSQIAWNQARINLERHLLPAVAEHFSTTQMPEGLVQDILRMYQNSRFTDTDLFEERLHDKDHDGNVLSLYYRGVLNTTSSGAAPFFECHVYRGKSTVQPR